MTERHAKALSHRAFRTKIMRSQVEDLRAMLNLQDDLNCAINSQWRNLAREWYRAIWTECAELMDHIGWKWWKHQSLDQAQVHLEIVDIWHFAMSDLLTRQSVDEVTLALAPEMIKVTVRETIDVQALRDGAEALALSALQTKRFSPAEFWVVMEAAALPCEKLFRLYLGKNVLNQFRQDEGYAKGSYRKAWAGEEDNVWLNRIVENIPATTTDFLSHLRQELKVTYDRLRDR
jgi:dimeric dUTPase (all-alpha-NTP-PPase superfamily)